jgi:hypothetical protein
LQRYRIEHPTDIRLLGMSSYLVDYPFADRLYPGALEVLNRLRTWGQTVILRMAMWSFNRVRSSALESTKPSGDMYSSKFTRRRH